VDLGVYLDITTYQAQTVIKQDERITQMSQRTLNDPFNPVPIISPLRKKRILYRDFHKDLTVNPISGDLALRTNEDAIKESLKNLILTDRGERLMQPNLGSDVRASLFENATPITLKILEERVREVINNFEPRVSIINIDVISLYDDNRVSIIIHFYVKNQETPQSVELFIERIR
jgi:phage baseplate assembly protein W